MQNKTNKIICRLLQCIGLFLLVCLPAQAQQDPVFSVLTGPRSLDGEVKDSSTTSTSNPTQLFVDAMFREAGLEYTFNIIPWSRAQQLAQSEPNVLLFAMVRIAEREDLYEWIGSIYPAEIYLYALKGMLADPPTNLEEARQYRIGLDRSSVADVFLSNLGFKNLIHAGNPTRSPILLKRGRVDLWPMTPQEASGIIRDHELEDDALIPLIKLDEISSGTYFVVSKSTDPALVERLRGAYTRLVEDGTYAELLGQQNKQGQAERTQ